MRSVERKISSKSKIYFQLNVSLTRVLKLPSELVDFYGFDAWLMAAQEEHKLIIFHNDENKEALEWRLIDYSNGNLGFVIGETNVHFEQEGLVNHSKIENLFNGCLTGEIKSGCLLYGTIAKRNVEPYKFDGKMVSSHTRPVLWPRELSNEEKWQYIEKIFAKNGKIVSKVDRTWDRFNNQVEEHSGYSDGYGGYLDDDFINDVLDGDADAYWNID